MTDKHTSQFLPMAHSRISGKLQHIWWKRSCTTSLASDASARVWQIMSHQFRRLPTKQPRGQAPLSAVGSRGDTIRAGTALCRGGG